MKPSYLLLLKASNPLNVRVGSFGILNLPQGYYVYVGSAGGPGGVEARVRRHRRLAELKRGRLRWHVDYLLVQREVRFLESWKLEKEGLGECQISKKIEKISTLTLTGFGSSDCRAGCKGHLHYFKRNPRKTLARLLKGLKFAKV